MATAQASLLAPVGLALLAIFGSRPGGLAGCLPIGEPEVFEEVASLPPVPQPTLAAVRPTPRPRAASAPPEPSIDWEQTRRIEDNLERASKAIEKRRRK